MKEPPIPFVEPYQCPNCGHPLRELVEICPQCGARIESVQRKPQWLNYLMITALALIMVPLGLAGACYLVLAPADISPDLFDGGSKIVRACFGLLLTSIAVLCGLGIKKLKRK